MFARKWSQKFKVVKFKNFRGERCGEFLVANFLSIFPLKIGLKSSKTSPHSSLQKIKCVTWSSLWEHPCPTMWLHGPRGPRHLPPTSSAPYATSYQTGSGSLLKGQAPSQLICGPHWFCILFKAAWQSLAECLPTTIAARPPNSPTRLRPDDNSSQARFVEDVFFFLTRCPLRRGSMSGRP